MKKILIIFIIIISIGTIFSIYKFQVYNPISACWGMLQILLTDKEYVVVQKSPHKVVFTKPWMFDEYMKQQGYYRDEDKQMGANSMFTNGADYQSIYTRSNAYYSLGVWN